jgi:hypothetical protein
MTAIIIIKIGSKAPVQCRSPDGNTRCGEVLVAELHPAQLTYRTGRDGLFNLVKSLPAGSKSEHGIMMAEGDYVMIHSRYSNPDGSAIVVVCIMRTKDGVFEEHWDVIQPEATEGESKSKLPMFGDSFPR